MLEGGGFLAGFAPFGACVAYDAMAPFAHEVREAITTKGTNT